MPGDRAVVVRGFSWRDLCPWLVIFRSFRQAISLPVLCLATCGVLLQPLGWKVAAFLLVGDSLRQTDAEFSQLVDHHGAWSIAGSAAARLTIPGPDDAQHGGGNHSVRPWRTDRDSIVTTFQHFARPFQLLVTTRQWTVAKFLYLSIGILWTLLVWGFFGGAITRIAVIRFGREENVELKDAFRFALRRLRSYIAAPLFPLAGVGLLVLPCLLLGLLLRLNVGALIAAIVWPLVLVAGLAITVLLLGLLFGWPLMYVAISGEEAGDMFEALHRSFSYTFQRPLHYLFYAVVAFLLGLLSWLFVSQFAESVITMSHWATSWGAGNERWQAIQQAAIDESASGTVRNAAAMFAFWHAGVQLIAGAFRYSFFWCAAAAIYLLLRQNVDDTEFDELFVESEKPQRSLPQLAPDIAKTTAEAPASTATSPPPAAASEASQG